jgi:hypothetical protein
MIPNWAAPFGWVLFCIACGTVLAIVLVGCQAPLRTETSLSVSHCA